jgi:hypothetical protein
MTGFSLYLCPDAGRLGALLLRGGQLFSNRLPQFRTVHCPEELKQSGIADQ